MFKKHDLVILFLLALSGYFLYYTNVARAEAGFWMDGHLIFMNNLAYILFFGLMTGYVLSNLLQGGGIFRRLF